MTHLCNLNRLEIDETLSNVPMWFGEWSLATQFDATDEFLVKWADAQKLAYTQGAGWIVSPSNPCNWSEGSDSMVI